ncbi:fluoride efflux transporter CrcB [Puniceicoccus vermicola]|uniref:Fluoride-specific ion channel FluC n=1 Tax=Puniceicoccus vermicola TaxID=388746 RepID=A0A7X1AYA3_9BACT|nr:fluoride efflux transporter CrcB [Puniceicoccus vermicola]MBC2602004.1 fluoride efflux transporter CrcB [Puniceicoccus vermicola]
MTAHLIAVFVGGGLGASSRFLMSIWITDLFAGRHALPVGTMFCNVTGSFIIGVGAAFAVGSSFEHHPLFRHLILIGFLGGYTTFSSFSLETITLLQNGKSIAAAITAIGTVSLCLIGVTLGSGFGSFLRNQIG